MDLEDVERKTPNLAANFFHTLDCVAVVFYVFLDC